MLDKNDDQAKLIKMANLTKEKLMLESEFEKVKKEILAKDEKASIERVVYSLPTQHFVAIKDNQSGDWVTTEDCRWIFKKKMTSNLDQSSMIPVGLINLDTKEVVLFNLAYEDPYLKDKTKNKIVVPFYPGFFIRKNIEDNSCPQYSVNLGENYTWFHLDYRGDFDYEWVTPSNPEQIQEVGTPVIGYIPFIIGVDNFSEFEFYQAYN